MMHAPAGVAGMDAETALARWGEESPHALRTPGAYEWWYFRAIDARGNGVLLALFQGLPFHPTYLSAIHRHAHKTGGKTFEQIRPGLKASQYPAVYFAVYEGGKRTAQFLNMYPAGGNLPSSDVPDIRIGPNRVTLRQDGSFGIVARGYPFDIVRGRPRVMRDRVLSTSLTFRPTFPAIPHVRPFRIPGRNGAMHQWVIAAPHGKMEGTVRLVDNAEGMPLINLQLDALGYHDHVYGQGGLSQGVKKLLWGYVQGETWTAAWHRSMAPAAGPASVDGLVLFRKGHRPLVVEGPECREEEAEMTAWLLKHPGRITMYGSTARGQSVEFVLHNNAVLDAAPSHTQLAALGTLTMAGRRPYAGTGVTHVMKLGRLQWPILSDLTLRAITPVSPDDPVWRE
jgi:carotenoid 1,2-hydratase